MVVMVHEQSFLMITLQTPLLILGGLRSCRCRLTKKEALASPQFSTTGYLVLLVVLPITHSWGGRKSLFFSVAASAGPAFECEP
jgi:hypothetical protein